MLQYIKVFDTEDERESNDDSGRSFEIWFGGSFKRVTVEDDRDKRHDW